jgi:uncharacterized protein YqeY
MTADLNVRIQADITAALRTGDKTTLTTLRTVLSAVQTAEKSGKAAVEFTDEQVLDVLARERKRRIETAAEYTAAGRLDRAEREFAEAELIGTYMPRYLTEQETADVVYAVVAGGSFPGATMRDLGAIIKHCRELATSGGNLVDGKILSDQVKAALSAT